MHRKWDKEIFPTPSFLCQSMSRFIVTLLVYHNTVFIDSCIFLRFLWCTTSPMFPFRKLKARVWPSDVALHNEADATALPCENNEKKKAQRTPNQGTRGMVKVTKSSLSCPDMARWVWFFLESIIHFLVINFGFANILVAKNYLPPRCTEVPPVLFGGGPSRF